MNLVGGSLGVLTASPMKDVLDKPAVRRAPPRRWQTKAPPSLAPSDATRATPRPGANWRPPSHLQSIAQDLLAGRPMEIDALFRVPLDLAALAAVPTPTLDLVIELATQRARAAGLYDDSAR